MIKKILCTTLTCAFASLTFATTINITNESGASVQLNSEYQLIEFADINDIAMAAMLGEINYLKKAIAKDPKIISKINDLKPAPIIGFGVRNVNTLLLLIKNDPTLLSRKNGLERNILLNELSSYYEVIEKFADIDVQVQNEIKNKRPEFYESVKEVHRKKDTPEFHELINYLINNYTVEQLALTDVYKNTALHYATYIRSEKDINSLLEKLKYNNKMAKNIYDENVLFMLLDQNCHVKKNEDKDILILDLLLKNKINPLQKNNYGYSFAAIVLSMDKFKYLRPKLIENLNALQKKILENEVKQIKLRMAKYPDEKNIKADYYSLISHQIQYNNFSCNVNVNVKSK